jgi:SAM-dependent methyltransferase
MNPSESWQLKIFKKTLKKKEKLAIIQRLLPDLKGKKCLDLGCAKGTISYFLGQEGGSWVHEDLDFSNVSATRDLVGAHTAVIPPETIPHANNTFDVIVSLDILEHLHQDRLFVKEMARVLKPGGKLILSTPATGPVFLLNRVKNWTGLTPDKYGHVVEGYTLLQLETMLSDAGFNLESADTYSRFFTELVEFLINLVFVKFLRKSTVEKRDGHISPGSAEEINKYRKQLRIYALIYPWIWLFTRLDKLLWWQKGYATLLVASKPGSTHSG